MGSKRINKKTMKLITLQHLSKEGVCVVITKNVIKIYNSSNILLSLSQDVHYFKPESYILHFYSITGGEHRSLMYKALYDRYKKKYTMSNKKPANWNIRISVEHFNPNKVFIYLENTYQSIVVGVFCSLKEAKTWKKCYYEKIECVIIATNDLTKQYYLREKV